ncbi:MAG TPA: glycosyltransferase family 39 protein [Solirubrobacteraceae bacterium]|nr:glycosyltransferase family 39 protein [Solirubrobacteraceae bacterium]
MSESRVGAQPSPRGERIAICALTVLALALRLTSLSRSLFTDETYSFALAQRGFGHMLALFAYESNGTLYSVALWPLVRIFGSGEALLRAPAVLAGVAGVPAMWWAARGLAGGRVALIAAGLLAINPMAVWYSQEARAYAFIVLACCLAFGALARALEREGPARRTAWIGYVAAMAALAYCQLLAVPIVLPAQALIARRKGREGVRAWLGSLLVLAVCCVPLLIITVISRSRRNPLYWLPKPSRGLVELALQEFTGGFSGVTAVRWLTLALGVALLAGAIWGLRQAADEAGERMTLAIAAGWALIPSALLLVVSVAEPVFWPRYAIVALPGLCLLGGLCAERMWQGPRSMTLAIALLAAIALVGAYADARQVNALQEDWPPIATWLKAERAPGEPIVVDNALVLASMGYYDPTFKARDGELIVQEWHDQSLPTAFYGFKDRTGYGSFPDGPPSEALFSRLATGPRRSAWLIVSEVDRDLQADPKTGAAVGWARRHCHVQVRESAGVWALHATGCS